MKREGWQHGVLMVRRPSLHLTGDAPGFYAKAPSRPSSHSKHTGKCRKPRCTKCHSLPVSKSRDKAKGAHKLRSYDVALNHRLESWRVVDDGLWKEEDDGEDEVEEHEDQFHQSVDFHGEGSRGGKEDEEDLKEHDDDDMGFCKVGFIMEYLDGEDWCMVDEI